MHLQELKRKTPADLLTFAEELEIENASAMRKQDLLFSILKKLAEKEVAIYGDGVIEILQDGFGFLRSPEANYLPGIIMILYNRISIILKTSVISGLCWFCT